MTITFKQCQLACSDPEQWEIIFKNPRTPKVQTDYDQAEKNIEHIKKQVQANGGVAVMPNGWPYNVYAHHLLVWFEPDKRINAEQIIREGLDNKEHCYSQSPRHLRSIPDLDHFHLFIKK
jgi:hypothetical protein